MRSILAGFAPSTSTPAKVLRILARLHEKTVTYDLVMLESLVHEFVKTLIPCSAGDFILCHS